MTVLLSDPQITSIPVQENGERLVDLATLGIRYSGEGDAGRFVRADLGHRLQRAQDFLPAGLSLLVREGYRSATEQESIIASYSAALRRDLPGLDPDSLRRMTSRFVAPLAVAPHVAGAAVDLTVVGETGTPLWMGTAIDATPEESDNACAFDATNISAQARINRDLLATALGSEGLVNYPTEWWHWSYGDRYWAYRTGADSAIYGPLAEVAAA